MADYAESLARTYLERGECSRDLTDYLKAHGLANYCVAVDSTPDRCRLVYDVEVSWYQGNHPISYKEHQQLTDAHKQLLNEYRDEVKSNFLPLDVLGLSLDAEDVYSDENMTNAQKFSDELFKISKKCSDGFVSITRRIIESSVEMLKHISMNAPCDFTVIGLGSAAKGEATPYTHVEYAVITERDDKNYFEMLAMDSYFRIGNLGETPLKCFNIEELKVKKGSPPVITDLRTVGYRIDGIRRTAGNIPTGSGLEKSQSLTFTVDSMMKLYKTSAESRFIGMADKSDMLSSTVVIYTNEGHESQLYNRFIEERMAYELNVARNSFSVKKKRMKSFRKDVNAFTFLPEFIKYHPPQNMNIRVKTDIFRYPTLLANNIKMCMGWNLRYPWQIYSELHSRKMMSEDSYQYMRIVLSLSIYMRTRANLHLGSQTEYVSLHPQQTRAVKELYQIPISLFVVLGCLLMPIKCSVKSNIENIALSADDTSLADTIDSVMQFNKGNLMVKVEICYFAGEYEMAKKELSKVIKAPIETTTSTEFLGKVLQAIEDSTSASKYMELCCYILYHTRSYRAAADFFSWLIDNGQGDIDFWKLLFAHCKTELGDYRATRQLLDEVGYTRSFYSESGLHLDIPHQDTCDFYSNIGIVYRDLGEYENALKYHKLALEMGIALYGESVNIATASTCNYIATMYRALGEYTSSLEYSIRSLKMFKAIYGADTNHPDVARSYNNIATVYRQLGDYSLSLEYYIKSLEMMKAVYGADTNHPDVANAYNNIATVYHQRGDYSLSLEYCIKSLEMMKAVYGADTNHPDIANAYNNIATVYRRQGSYSLSLEYYIKPLEMMKAIYGAETDHPAIANTYNNIATVYRQRGDYSLSLEYYIKSLEMMKAVYGADTHHPDIANAYNNVATVYLQRGDYSLSLEYHIKFFQMMKFIFKAYTNHPEIASDYNNIATAYSQCGDNTLPLEYSVKSFVIRKATYRADTDHPGTANNYKCMAILHEDSGKYGPALDYFMKSLQVMKAIHGSDSNHPDIANGYSNVGRLNRQIGEYSKALEWYKKSLSMNMAIYGQNSNHPSIANSTDAIGSIYDSLGNYKKALEHFTKSSEMVKAIYEADTNNIAIARSLNNIANVYSKMGKYASSLDFHKKSLVMMKSVYKIEENHRDLANCYISVGDAYNSLGEHDLAIANYREALEMTEVVYGADQIQYHPDIANCCDKEAKALSENNSPDFTLSLQGYKKALEMRKAIYGVDTNHPDIVASYNNIGTVHSIVKDYESAEKFFKDALSMAKEIYGDEANHPDIANSLSNLDGAKLMLELEHEGPVSSLSYYTKSLAMQLEIYGSNANHPNIADTCAHMGDAYVERYEYESALKHHFEALEIRKAIYGAEAIHPDIALSHSSIGEIYHLLGELSLSLNHMMTSLDMKKEIYEGKYNHFDVATAHEKVASLNCELERHISALDYYTKALEMKEALYGKNSTNLHIAESYTYIGIVYSHLKEYTKSLDYHTRSLKIRQAKQVDGRPQDVAESYSNIAKAQNCLQNYDKSLENYSNALDIQLGIHRTTANHKSVATCYSDMAEVYNNMKVHTKALDHYKNCLKMHKDGYGADTNQLDIATCCTNMAMIYTVLGKFSTALEYHTQALTIQQALSDARSKETTSLTVTKGYEPKSAVTYPKPVPSELSTGSREGPFGATDEMQVQKSSIQDRGSTSKEEISSTDGEAPAEKKSVVLKKSPIPQEIKAEISKLCRENSVASAMLVQDPDDYKRLIVMGINVKSLEPLLTDVKEKFPDFHIIVHNKSKPLYTRQKTRLYVARRSPPGIRAAEWTGGDEVRATLELLVDAEEKKGDNDGGFRTIYAVVPAHLSMNKSQTEKFLSLDHCVYSVDIEGQTTRRRYTLRGETVMEVCELNHPPLFCYRHWSQPTHHSDAHHMYMNDIALLKVSKKQAGTVQGQLNLNEPTVVRELRKISDFADLDYLHLHEQPVVVRGKDAYLISINIEHIPPSLTHKDAVYARHLTFRLRKTSEGNTQELIKGDCGSIVYFQGKDGYCQPMGMFVGEFDLPVSPPVYQAIVLNQAFDDLECSYPHHVRDIRPFNPC